MRNSQPALKAREDELNEIQSNLAELKEALETGPIAELIKSIVVARAAMGASESSAPGEPSQAPGDAPAPQTEAPEATAEKTEPSIASSETQTEKEEEESSVLAEPADEPQPRNRRPI